MCRLFRKSKKPAYPAVYWDNGDMQCSNTAWDVNSLHWDIGTSTTLTSWYLMHIAGLTVDKLGVGIFSILFCLIICKAVVIPHSHMDPLATRRCCL